MLNEMYRYMIWWVHLIIVIYKNWVVSSLAYRSLSDCNNYNAFVNYGAPLTVHAGSAVLTGVLVTEQVVDAIRKVFGKISGCAYHDHVVYMIIAHLPQLSLSPTA